METWGVPPKGGVIETAKFGITNRPVLKLKVALLGDVTVGQEGIVGQEGTVGQVTTGQVGVEDASGVMVAVHLQGLFMQPVPDHVPETLVPEIVPV